MIQRILTDKRFSRFKLLMNDIIRYDRTLSALSVPAVDDNRSLRGTTTFWRTAVAAYAVFFVVRHKYTFDVLSIQSDVIGHVIEFLFVPPRVMDFVIVVTACFHMSHLGRRFRALDAACRRTLPCGGHRRRTTSETAALVETLRLLHAELCDMFRLFTRCYGPIVMAYLLFTAVDLVCDLYYMMVFKHFVLGAQPCISYVQNMVFVFGILFAASWTDSMKRKLIKNLRLCRIEKLQYKANIQIKLFMEQINVFERTETLACGIINFKLSLILPIMVLMITISSTLFQLKNQAFFIQFFNTTVNNGPWNE